MPSILLLAHPRPDGEVDLYHLKPGRRYHIGRGSRCEIRVLDLKLSRQHAAIECDAAGQWVLVDLCSTNGCQVDGRPAVGTVPLAVGSVVSAGLTSLTVHAIVDAATPAEELPPAPLSPVAAAAAKAIEQAAADTDHPPMALPAGSEHPLERSPSGRVATSQRAQREEARTPLPMPIEVSGDQDCQATLSPMRQVAPEAGRGLFITVLGRRIGPLTREQARELKARELRGQLTAADLDQLPQAGPDAGR